MPVATQVKRRRGTAEENNAFTGAEGEITVDLTNKTLRVHDGETLGGTAVETQRNKTTTITAESTDAQYPSAKAVVDYVSTNSGGAMPVGAIFTTPRTGVIAGTVEANGGEYNIADYSGEGSIGALLTAGSIAYVSKTEFQTQVTNTGACDSFGWDGATDPTFLVPKLNPWHVGKSAPVVGNGMSVGMTNGLTNYGLIFGSNVQNANAAAVGASTEAYGKNTGPATSQMWAANSAAFGLGITTDGTKSGMIADLSETTNLRVMVQLATGATDQALETCTSVLADVSELKDHRVIEFQAPTAENGYTWYRKYADGWVEQGGQWTHATGTLYLTLPVAMASNEFSVIGSYGKDYSASNNNNFALFAYSTTQICLQDNNTGTMIWQVSGMAA